MFEFLILEALLEYIASLIPYSEQNNFLAIDESTKTTLLGILKHFYLHPKYDGFIEEL